MLNKYYTHITNPIIATSIGQNESVLLNQILYWLSKCGRKVAGQKEKWIYNSLAEWQKQFSYWSMYKLRKTIKSLENLGLIKSIKFNSKKWNHTKWYTIDYNNYEKLLKKLGIEKNISNKKNVINLPILSKFNKYKIIKSTNRFVENQQIIITKNNYTNKFFYMKKNLKEKMDFKKINQEKKENAKQMIDLWNKVFEYSLKPIKAYINQKNQRHLLLLYKEVFNSDLNNWRDYACKVNSSQFLMGEKKTKNNFKAVFSWLIKTETIEKVLNGEYGIGDRELDMNNLSKNIEKKKEEVINKMNIKILEYLKLNINETIERKAFEKYVKTLKNTGEIDDVYGILNVIKHIPYYTLFKTNKYKEIRENLYKSYIMKKYLNITKMEARKKIKNKMKAIIEGKEKESSILNELNKKGREIEYLKLNQNIENKIDLQIITE